MLAPRCWLLALLAIDLASRLSLALGGLERLDTALLDDAFLSWTIARSIGEGHGPLYGLQPTNGFQPLWVFLCAPLFAWLEGAEAPIHGALVLAALCDAGSLCLLWWMVRRHASSPWAPATVAVAWIALPYVAATTVNGLETQLALLLALSVIALADRWLGGPALGLRPRQALTLGGLLGLAMVARIDAGFLGAALALWTAARLGTGRARVARPVATLALAALGFGLAYGPWLAYSLAWTGEAFPVSGRAVRWLSLHDPHAPGDPGFANLHGPLLWHGLVVWTRHQGIPLAAAALLLVWATATRARAELGRVLGTLAVPLLFCAGLYLAYAFWVLAPWYWDRYLFPALLPVLLGLGQMTDLTVGRLRRGRALAGSALLAGLLATCLAKPALHDLYAPRAAHGYLRIGRFARQTLPPGTVVGATQSGAIGYFATQATIVNLDGVVNRDALAAQQGQRLLDYARAQGVSVVLGWEENLRALLERSHGATVEALQVEPAIAGADTYGKPWYLARLR